jgi:hypothetical protein
MARAATARNHAARHNRREQRGFAFAHPPAPYLYYCLLVLVVVLFALIRIRLRGMPLERDEGEYAYGGQLLLHGFAPYKFLYSVKLPGTYAAYAAMLGLFGQSAARIHLGLLIVNATTTLLLFFVCSKLFGRLAAFVAAGSYALLSVDPYVNGLAAHATQFVVFFAVAAILVLLRGLEADRPSILFAAGLLFGLAFLMKQPGLVFAVWAVVYLVRKRVAVDRWYQLRRQAGALIAGAVLPFAITCLLMLATGEFRNFWFWTFSYVRQYGTAVPLKDGARLFYVIGSKVFASAPAIWLLALVGLTTCLWNDRARANSFFTNSLLLFSFAGVSAGLYFRPHYFIVVLPAVSIFVGLAVSCATEKLLARGRSRIVIAFPALIFLFGFSSTLYLQRDILFRLSPAQASRAIYRVNPFPEAVELAAYIRSHTRDGDAIAVLGSEPEIFFYSHRRSATGFVYMYPLLDPDGSGVEMQKQMIQEVERSRPAMLVVVNVPSSWIAYASPASMQGITSWMKSYLDAYYVQDGVVEIGDTSRYFWGDEAYHFEPRTRLSLLLFKRKESS